MSRINLNKAPTAAHIFVSIGATLFLAGVIHGSLLSRGKFLQPPTGGWSNAVNNCLISMCPILCILSKLNSGIDSCTDNAGVRTFDRTDKWQNATNEYMKFNKMNPIFGKTSHRMLYNC